MKLALGTTSITAIGAAGGVFFGKKNTCRHFRSERVLNEVVGTVSGNDNTVRDCRWMKRKV